MAGVVLKMSVNCSVIGIESILGQKFILSRSPFSGAAQVTDGVEIYGRVVGEVFGVNCCNAQVLKTRRNNRVVKVERREEIGSRTDFDEALLISKGSETLNTSFIERLNLTLRVCLKNQKTPAIRPIC